MWSWSQVEMWSIGGLRQCARTMSGLKHGRAIGVLLGVALVAASTAVLRGIDADLTVAALVYVAVVVAATLFGAWAGAVAAVLCYVNLNYWFIPKYESFTFSTSDDVVTLVAFALAAGVTAVTIARVNSLRRHAQEHERAAFEARLDAAMNESRAGFRSAMTHNLRTPLASIKAAVSTLQGSPPVDERTRQQLLVTAREETERLERLVTKVLELSRIHAGAVDPRPEPTDIAELTRG